MIEINKVYNEDCRETIKRMPDNFIDMILTSPPYDNRRTYEDCKWNFDVFKSVADGFYRIMKENGVIVWVVNDETKDFCETLTSFKHVIYFVEKCKFNLLDTMIYYKKGGGAPVSPSIAKYRYSPCFEYMFIFCKGKKNTFNPLKVKCINAGIMNNYTTSRQINGVLKRVNPIVTHETKIKNNVWEIMSNDNTDNKENDSVHPAVFPKQLVIDHIKSWTNENDVVFDPFAGSGTVAKVCQLLNRKFICSEISKNYCDLINKTLIRTNQREKGSKIWL
jgi:site-specific DNA-methyltransferase (adenine-specific)